MPATCRSGFHHIDLNVRDLEVSKLTYALVLEFLGYRRVRDDADGCEWDLGSGGNRVSLGLRAAHPDLKDQPHARYAPGLHHLAWSAASRDDVDAIFLLLRERGIRILDAPAAYPEYSESYYAVFFEDPDGMKLEVLHED